MTQTRNRQQRLSPPIQPHDINRMVHPLKNHRRKTTWSKASSILLLLSTSLSFPQSTKSWTTTSNILSSSSSLRSSTSSFSLVSSSTSSKTRSLSGCISNLPLSSSSSRLVQRFMSTTLDSPIDNTASTLENNNTPNDNNYDTTKPGELSDTPLLGSDGVYHILTPQQHRTLLEANPDKLIVLKIFAPWCRACKGLEPKFHAIVKDDKYDNLPLIFADLTVQHNKDFVKAIGVLALPTIQFYAGSEGLVDNFPCGPSKVPILKRKLARFINERVDAKTRTIKPPSSIVSTGEEDDSTTVLVESTPVILDLGDDTTNGESTKKVDSTSTTTTPSSTLSPTEALESGTAIAAPAAPSHQIAGIAISEEIWQSIRTIPFFRDLTEKEFHEVLSKAKVLSFEPGSIILREGMPGRMFYVIEDGEVEVCQKTVFADPLTTPPSYLGTVINRLTAGDYFGERSLITGEPRAASIRASEKTRCFAFDVSDIPASTILSGKAGLPTPQRLKQVNDKYGVALTILSEKQLQKQLLASQAASQMRGSVNSPKPIKGVDVEGDLEIDFGVTGSAVPQDEDVDERDDDDDNIRVTIQETGDDIYPLLKRFQLIRHVSRCFDYIMKERPDWGDVIPGSKNRRSMLLNRLTPSQIAEFQEVFQLIDASNDGEITLLELKRVMESIGAEKSDDELLEMITTGHGGVDGKKVITMEDFMGIMAEAELFHLFRDTFAALDRDNTGFVRAADLDRVLCGVRDLIADDHKSIIDVEDKDIMIDYEEFSKWMLGVTLK